MKQVNSLEARTIGALLIVGAIAVLIPYTMLTMTFDYPDILRLDTSTILTRFHEGGSSLIWTWFAFAVTGLPLLPAFIWLGRMWDDRSPMVRIATTIGVIALVVQIVGLLRWTFVVPVLSDTYVHATDEATKAAAVVVFKAIHQFGGVILGEHLGQLFTIAWTVMMTVVMMRARIFSWWIHILGLTAAVVYAMSQAELFATVMPSFPVWDLAGFLGSTLWLIWLVVLGVALWRRG